MTAADTTTPHLQLARFVRLGIQKDTLYLGFGSVQQPIDRQDLWRPLAHLAELWLKPLTATDAERLLVERGVASELAHEAVAILRSGGFVVPANEIDWSDRYSRHSLFYQLSGARPEEVHTAIGTKHVAIVGCGGIGNLVAAHLATAGVGQLTLVDDDDVELSNLTRQIMFTEADVSRSKAKALQERVSDRNTTVTIDALVSGVANAEDLGRLPEADLIIVSADRAGVVELINEYSVTRGTPWIGVGYVNDIATWGPFVVPGVTGCWACHQLVATPAGVDDELRDIIRRANANYQAPRSGRSTWPPPRSHASTSSATSASSAPQPRSTSASGCGATGSSSSTKAAKSTRTARSALLRLAHDLRVL